MSWWKIRPSQRLMTRTDHRAIAQKAILFLGSSTGYLVVSHFLNGVPTVRGHLLVGTSAGLAIPLGVMFGLPAALGVGVGVLLDDVLRFAFSLNSVFNGLSHFIAASFAHVLWRHDVHPIPSPSKEGSGSVRFWVDFAVVALLASTSAAAFLAWGYEILGAFPFYTSFVAAFTNYLLATTILTPLLVYPAFRFGVSSNPKTPRGTGGTEMSNYASVRSPAVVLPVLWAVFGVVGSIGFRMRERVPYRAFQLYDIGFVYEVIHPDVFGHGGRRAQVVFGALMLLLLASATKRVDRQKEGKP